MAKVKVVVKEVPEEIKDAEVEMREAAHKAFLAGVGAAAVVQDWLASNIAKLVEQGEAVEQEYKQMVSERMDKGKHKVRKLAKKRAEVSEGADAELEKGVGEILSRMNVPTKSDIEALGAQVDELTKKVDELKKG